MGNKDDFSYDDIKSEYPTIVMKDDDTGEDVEFIVMDSIVVEGEHYFLVIESDDIDNENAEALLLKRSKSDDGKEVVYSIAENDSEFESVIQMLNESSDDYSIEM